MISTLVQSLHSTPKPGLQVTGTYANLFCNSDRQRASALLLPKLSSDQSDYFLLHLVRLYFKPVPD